MTEPIITNRQMKEFASLDDAKGRRKTGLFVAEGTKCVLEIAETFAAAYVYATRQWIDEHSTSVGGVSVTEVPLSKLRELTRLSSTPQVIGYFHIPEPAAVPEADYFANNLVVMLDCVQDPGNLGTILRTCDWMGVRTIIASRDTVDAFNPKVVQATMGGLARTRIVYTDLPELLASLDGKVPVYGTFLDGENIYTTQLSATGIVVMGNEGKGISAAVEQHVSHHILIPPYPADSSTVESLNVAIATAITLSQFRARQS